MIHIVKLFAVLSALAWTLIGILAVPGLLRIKPLPVKVNQARRDSLPTLSVIIAARNEEKGIQRTLRSLQAQQYPRLEVIAVNDRSEDATGSLMDEMKRQWPELKVIHVDTLPSGWLGKNHALWVGAAWAKGDWLLFTDGDVIFYPHALERALDYVMSHRVDHLTIPPRMVLEGYWLRSLVALFVYNLTLFFRPQNVSDPKSDAYMGIGAFNLIQKRVYQSIGTHASIRLRPDDDLKLGEKVKHCGFSQEFIPAYQFIEVKWYASLHEMMVGLEKNALAPFRYNIALLLMGMIPFLLFYLLPFLGPFVSTGWTRLGYIYCLLLMFVMYRLNGLFTYLPLHLFIGLPVAVLLFAYILVRAALLAWLRGGIIWRGTFYSLKDLRKQSGKG